MALYPPIVASSMPAFDINSNIIKIYYTLPFYNVGQKENIKTVHITVRKQNSNVNMVNNSKEILEDSFGKQDQIDKTLNRYYIQIKKSSLKKIVSNNAYKVQLRFSLKVNTGSNNFYTNDIENFSEWSTVCIIKPIDIPIFYIDEFNASVDGTYEQPKQTDQNKFYSTLADFTGIYKQQSGDNIFPEPLKNWRLRLLSKDYIPEYILKIDDYTLADSGIILNQVNNYNTDSSSVVLSCSLPYQLKDKQDYKLYFQIQTKNNYEKGLLYNFTCNQTNINRLQGNLQTYINEQQGYIKLDFKSSEVYFGNLLIRRTDSKSNFLKWEDLKYFETKYFEDYENTNFTYYDFTVESGLLYRYLVQKVDPRGRRSTPVYDQSKSNGTGVMAEWEHAFLLESTGNGELKGTRQLKLKYDFQISSYKTNISENKVDTIGSKYPYIRRNGNMYYRSFPITGTITQFMDQASLFTSKEQMFNSYYQKYKNFKGKIGQHGIQYDYTYERKFRQQVEKFLYNSKPKLYKSMQQGNIFIKLMDISLTPKNELGRLVYSFSATAYQIEEASIKTYNDYELITVGEFNPNVSKEGTLIGQINSFDFNDDIQGNMFKAGQDIVGAGQTLASQNSIAKKIKYLQPINDTVVTDFNINWIRFTIESDPYLIIETLEDGKIKYRPYDDVIPSYTSNNPNYIDKNIIRNGKIESIKDNNYQDTMEEPINYPLYQIESTYKDTNIYLGWLFTINGEDIIVSPPNNIYQIKDDIFFFKKQISIIPAKDIAMLVDYRVVEIVKEDISKTPKNIRINKVNGQLMGSFSDKANLISNIYYKYSYLWESGRDKIERQVSIVNSVAIDTQPHTVVYIKTDKMDNPQRVVINDNGQFIFDFMDELISIKILKIIGKNFSLDEVEDKGVVSSFQEINSPSEGYVCTLNNKKYYYHYGEWCVTEQILNQQGEISLDVHFPVDALVFYYAHIKEATY